VLAILISFKWWEAAVKELNIGVSERKITTEFARFRDEEYHSIAGYQRYLRRTGQTLADQYLRMRMDLYTTALNRRLVSEGVARYEQRSREFSKAWASKTICKASDVVPNCREYRGSAEPEAII
jgi:hypothetical protein